MSRCLFASVGVDDLTVSEAAAKIRSLLLKTSRGYVVTPNAAHIVALSSDEAFREAYRGAVLVLPDGVGVVLGCRLLGHRIRERCSGSDLFPRVLSVAAEIGLRVFLLGGVHGSEGVAAEKIRREFGLAVDAYSPPFGFEHEPDECEKIVRLINDFRTDVLFIHVGAPKSELWIARHIARLEIRLALCLGAALDYYVGRSRRAPRFVQQIGCEWLWRFAHEPRRLFTRYTVGNVRFLGVLGKEMLKSWSSVWTKL